MKSQFPVILGAFLPNHPKKGKDSRYHSRTECRRFWSVPTEAARCTAPCRSPSNKLLKKNPRTQSLKCTGHSDVGMCQQAPKQALCTPTLVPVPQASLTTSSRGLPERA